MEIRQCRQLHYHSALDPSSRRGRCKLDGHWIFSRGWSFGCTLSGIYAQLQAKRGNAEEAHDEDEERGRNVNSRGSLFDYPYVFWQLGLICMLGYGGINTFTNSAQRFLAFTFYAGDQRAAGSAKR